MAALSARATRLYGELREAASLELQVPLAFKVAQLVADKRFLACEAFVWSVSHLGTVHPQLPLQLLMIRGWSPVLVTLNSQVPFAPWSMVP